MAMNPARPALTSLAELALAAPDPEACAADPVAELALDPRALVLEETVPMLATGMLRHVFREVTRCHWFETQPIITGYGSELTNVAGRIGSGGTRAGSRGNSAVAGSESGLAGRELAVEAVLLALGVLLRRLGGSVTLVAFGSALVGFDGLGLVGTGDSETGSLARHIIGFAGGDTVQLGAQAGRGGSGSTGNGAGTSLRNGASNQGNRDGGVLHGDGEAVVCGGRCTR